MFLTPSNNLNLSCPLIANCDGSADSPAPCAAWSDCSGSFPGILLTMALLQYRTWTTEKRRRVPLQCHGGQSTHLPLANLLHGSWTHSTRLVGDIVCDKWWRRRGRAEVSAAEMVQEMRDVQAAASPSLQDLQAVQLSRYLQRTCPMLNSLADCTPAVSRRWTTTASGQVGTKDPLFNEGTGR